MNLDMLFVLLRIYVVLYKLDYFLEEKKQKNIRYENIIFGMFNKECNYF